MKVMIVDDDYLVRMDLHKQIDWNSQGYELLEDCINGKDAIEKMDIDKPDIIILDLEMPRMDGIEVLKIIKNRGWAIKSIILSCHEDYSNVKEAMRLGASDYLLKHNYQPSDLLKVLDQVRESLIKEREIQNEIEDNRTLAKRKKLLDVIREVNSPSAGFLSKIFGISSDKLNEYQYIVTVFEVDKIEVIPDDRKTYFDRVITNYYLSKTDSNQIVAGANQYVALYYFAKNYSTFTVYDKLMKDVKGLKEEITKDYDMSLSYGISDLFYDEADIVQAYKTAQNALKSKYFIGNNQVINPMDIACYNKQISINVNNIYSKLKMFIFEEDNAPQAISDLYFDFMKRQISIKQMFEIRHLIYESCIQILEDYSLESNKLFGIVEALNRSETMKEDIDLLSCFVKELKKSIQDNSMNTTSKIIDDVITYIKAHYNEQLSLKVISDMYHISVGHMSYLFKKKTGTTFVDYLNQYRIMCAKELLLKNNIKIYEVSDQVGFTNYRYFTKIFKSYLKVTPKKYKDLMFEKKAIEEGDTHEN